MAIFSKIGNKAMQAETLFIRTSASARVGHLPVGIMGNPDR